MRFLPAPALTRAFATVALTTLVAFVTPASSHAAVTLSTGTLTDAHRMPAAGTVNIYAWSRGGGPGQMPLVATAQTALDGTFTATAQDDAKLLDLASKSNGWIDFMAIGTTADHQGQWSFSLNVSGTPGTTTATSAHAASARAASHARAIGTLAPAITIKTTQQFAPPAGPAAHTAAGGPTCAPIMTVLDRQKSRALAIVGELNNAYNDGTVGTYTYGRDRSSDTDFGVAVSYDGGSSFSINGETHMGDSGSIAFPPFKRRLARKLRSMFEFTREKVMTNTCAKHPEVSIRATSWIGGDDEGLKQRGALDHCDPQAFQPYLSNSEFTRAKNSGVRFRAGAEAFGVNITTQTDFSTNTSLHYSFGRGRDHYLCGADGRQSPYESGRVFSGAR